MKKLRPGHAIHQLHERPPLPAAGNASSSKNAVTNCAQQKNGSRIQVMPGARS